MEIVAERIYHISTGDVTLKIFKPTFNSDVWQCGYEIIWPNKGKKTRLIDGLDSVESLLLTIKLANDFLDMIQRGDSEALEWQGGVGIGLDIEFDESG